MKSGVVQMLVRPVGLILRIVALTIAIILIALASAIVGLIQNNQPLIEKALDAENKEELQLLALLANTQSAAYWLIFLAVCVIIAEVVAVVLLLANLQTGRLVLDILELIFSLIVVFCYFSTGIACAVYASAWGATPEACATEHEDIDCKERAFTAINALQTLFCILQVVVFSLIGSVIIYLIILRKSPPK